MKNAANFYDTLYKIYSLFVYFLINIYYNISNCYSFYFHKRAITVDNLYSNTNLLQK